MKKNKNYVFDLDYTLYNQEDVDETNTIMFYKSFKEHKFMNRLLRSLDGNCYIFSNGNEPHVDEVTKKMKLQTIMKDMANIDEYNNEKEGCWSRI